MINEAKTSVSIYNAGKDNTLITNPDFVQTKVKTLISRRNEKKAAQKSLHPHQTMNQNYKDVFDDYADTRLSPKSMLFFQSYRPPQRAQTEMDDDLTPWGDAIGPRLFSNANRIPDKLKLEPKKRTISETQSNFYRVPKREKSVQNFATVTATEPSKEPENVETIENVENIEKIETIETVENVIDTTVDSVQVEVLKPPFPIISQQETPKSGNLLNFTVIGNNIEDKKPVERLPKMMATQDLKCYGTSASWLPHFSVPLANSEFKKGLIIHREIASRSNKFWLGQSKITHITNEQASVDSKYRTYTQHFESNHHRLTTDANSSFVHHDNVVGTGSPEPPQQVRITRNQSTNKGLFEAGPLSGIKTELNDFQKKLKGFGRYNFEKKCKNAVEKFFVKKKDLDNINSSATNIKLKLEILRKMNREEGDTSKANSCKPTLTRGKREKSTQTPGPHGPTKTNYDNDISLFHTEDSIDNFQEKPQTPKMAKEKRKNTFSVAPHHSHHGTESDNERQHSMEPRQQTEDKKSAPGLFKIQSPLIQSRKGDPTSIEHFSLDKGNTSYGKIIKKFADKRFFQAYGTADGKRPVTVMKSPAGVPKYVVSPERQTSNKLIRKRKNSKLSMRPQELSPLRELLKVDKDKM